jgi:hypothetical protein
MKILLAILLAAAGNNLGTGTECSGDYMPITKRLLKGFYYDSSIRIPVVKHNHELMFEEAHFVLFKMPRYHFGIDAAALPKNGRIKIYKMVSKKDRMLVYDSYKNGNPAEIHYEPNAAESRKYVVAVEIPEGAAPGCITVALGYSNKAETSSGVQNTNAKPRVKVVD